MSRPAAPEMHLFLVRHAQPAGGGRRFLGQADPPLGAAGEDQARLLAIELSRVHFDAAYSSDLRRCLETAEFIVERAAVPVSAERWLREIDTGEWEGLGFEEAARLFPAEHEARERDLIGRPFPGGESFRDLQVRAVPAFERLLDESVAAGRTNVLVVGHKGTNRVLICHLLGKPLESLFSIAQDYCAVSIFRVVTGPEGGYRVILKGAD